MKDLDMGGFESRAAPYMMPPPPLRSLPEVRRMPQPSPQVLLNIGVAYEARVVQLLSSAVPSPKSHTPLRRARQAREARSTKRAAECPSSTIKLAPSVSNGLCGLQLEQEQPQFDTL